ncbi:hypothetical protein GCM10028804_08090 [Larkinella terrae]
MPFAFLPNRLKMVVDKTHSTVTYTMKHPMHTWDGVSHEVSGAFIYNPDTRQIESGALAIKIASFDSKNANRDSHAIEVLEGLKYPLVTFTTQEVHINTGGALVIVGKLTFHGVTRPVTCQAKLLETGNEFRIEGSFPVSLSDFLIDRPSLMMVPVEDVMTLKFDLIFRNPSS